MCECVCKRKGATRRSIRSNSKIKRRRNRTTHREMIDQTFGIFAVSFEAALSHNTCLTAVIIGCLGV